ncbi:MAG: exosortase C-terminal domain/associated protein EpsI [Gammaproteobacteria bacterium]
MIAARGALTRLRAVALVPGATAAATAALWPAATSIAGNWIEIHDYQHGFLIAPVALVWLLVAAWQQRSEPLRPASVGLAMLAGILLAWLVALRAHSDIAMEALFPVIVWLTIYAAAGWRIAREAAGAIAYLYFAIPVWEFLLPALQWLSVHATEAALALAGIPAEVTEYFVTLPAGSFQIIEGCSGKRYFMVALAVSVIAGVFRHLRGWRLLELVALGGALALLANWIRIFVVIAAGHATDMQHYLVAVEHQTFGNVVFAVLLLAIYVSATIIGERATGRRDVALVAGSGTAVDAAPAIVVAPFLLLGAVAAVVHVPAQAAAATGLGLGPLPVAAGDWLGPMPPLPTWSPRFIGTDGEQHASYRRADGRAVQLYLNLYRSQQPGKELVNFRNNLLAPGAWSRAWPQRVERLEAIDAPALAALEVHAPPGQRWLLAYVYKVGDWTTMQAPLAQAGYGLQSLIRPAPSGIVSLTVQCSENCQEAQALVQVFWQDMSSSILGMISDDAA